MHAAIGAAADDLHLAEQRFRAPLDGGIVS